MSDVKWIKIVIDIFDDEKILLIESMPDADAVLCLWFKLLCLAGKVGTNGVLMLNDRIAFTDEMMATIFRRPVNTVRMALKTFELFGMIEIVEGTITIPNWPKHQNMDSIESKRVYMRDYMKQKRAEQRLLAETAGCKTNGKANSKANVSLVELDIEREREIDSDSGESPAIKRSKVYKPSIKEITAYCIERKNKVNPQAWLSHYESNGWMVGKNKMQDWKATVRTWEHNKFDTNGEQGDSSGTQYRCID